MITPEERRAALETAIKRAGGISKCAKALGISLQAISMWRKNNTVPFERALQIEQLWGVPRESMILPRYAEVILTPRHEEHDIL